MMMEFRASDRKRLEVDAKMRACFVLREAVVGVSPDNMREAFERAIVREVGYVLERGMRRGAIAAFEKAAAEMHDALFSHRHAAESADASHETVVSGTPYDAYNATGSGVANPERAIDGPYLKFVEELKRLQFSAIHAS